MTLFLTLFQAVAVLMMLGGIGFWLAKKKLIKPDLVAALNPLIIDLALPALVFTTIYRRFTPEQFPNWWQLPLWSFLFIIFVTIVGLLFARIFKKRERGAVTLGLLYPNAIFIPLAIIPQIFPDGDQVLVTLFLFTLPLPPLIFSTYFLFFPGDQNRIDLKKIFNPVLLAVLLSIGLKLFNIGLPQFISSTIDHLGKMALPLIMLMIGASIYGDLKTSGAILSKRLYLFPLIRNIITPGLMLGLLYLIQLPFDIAFLFILLTTVPPLSAIPILTDRAGGEMAVANRIILLSFLTSLISLPLILGLFLRFKDIFSG